MSAIRIKFDTSNNPEMPTFILGDKSGKKYGVIENISDINVSDRLNDCPEISFSVYKYDNYNECRLWDKLKNFMTVYCLEWDTWFEMNVDLSESTDILKNVILYRLGEAELSQKNLYQLEANTEDDIDRDDYSPTILYNSENPQYSLLHRILTKAPHYSIRHVDKSIAKLQRTFSFDKVSIKDAFDEISEELNCLFVYHSDSYESEILSRQISVYDLQSNCVNCGHRGDFMDECPECGSTDIKHGYGEDTNIFISADGLGNSVQLETNIDEVKNCFRLKGGDDDMTATIKNCSPSNSLYLWHFSDDMKQLMPSELVEKLNAYDEDYNHYNNEYPMEINMDAYNYIVNKYKNMDEEFDINIATSPIIGYSNLINFLYNVIDFKIYLESELMPSVKIDKTDAKAQMEKLIKGISPVSVNVTKGSTLSTVSEDTVKSSVLSMAKVLVDGRYEVKIKDGYTYSKETFVWEGVFTITSHSDEEDTATSEAVSVVINDKYEDFVKQKINKLLNGNNYDTSISWLFDIDKVSLDDFKVELKKYSKSMLDSFSKCCSGAMDLMIQQGISKDKETMEYNDLYIPYLKRSEAIKDELLIRTTEITIIEKKQLEISMHQNYIQEKLDLETYVGDMWPALCSYIRESEYENTNYSSEGLSNSELIQKATDFVKKATEDLYKSSTLQHKISADIKNLLMIKEFEPLVKKFQCGNWIRIQVDGVVYKLRLLEYDLGYDDGTLNVVFSDVYKIYNGITDLQSVLDQATSMASSYDFVKHQASQSSKSTKYVDEWVQKGLDVTNINIVSTAKNQSVTWDQGGILCREYDDILDDYTPKQAKIINKGLYLTTDNWTTSSAAIGDFIYYDPSDGQMKESYGVIADTLVGNLILSEKVGIYNQNNSISLGDQGLVITTNREDVGETQKAFTIQKKVSGEDGNEIVEKVMYIDDDGNLVLTGSILINSPSIEGASTLDSAFDVSRFEDTITNSINDQKDAIVTDIDSRFNGLSQEITEQLNKYKTDVGQFMRWDESTGLTLGATSSVFKTVIDNKGMYFKENENIVSYINNECLYIVNGVIKDTLLLGNFCFSPNGDDKGGFAITWQGN